VDSPEEFHIAASLHRSHVIFIFCLNCLLFRRSSRSSVREEHLMGPSISVCLSVSSFLHYRKSFHKTVNLLLLLILLLLLFLFSMLFILLLLLLVFLLLLSFLGLAFSRLDTPLPLPSQVISSRTQEDRNCP
jgi:hypothetical protein